MRSDRAAGHGAIAISVEDMHKSYGDVRALDGVSIDVAAGSVFALLGPNGAGKTTLVRILTTLLEPDAGRGTVAGYDVVSQRTELRNIIGLAGQFAAVDEHLTGRENLEMVGRLYHLDAAIARRRAGELLERFSIDGAADRRAKTYSGGMRRRLDLAASLVAEPEVCFSMSPPLVWTRGGATSCGPSSVRLRAPGPPFCSPPSTWTRPISSPIGSR